MPRKAETILPQADDVQDMIEVSEDAMSTAMDSYAAWLKNACEVQNELVSFVARRVREDIEMPMRFAECKSPADVLERQVVFTQKMFADYADESMKILDLMSDNTSQSPQ